MDILKTIGFTPDQITIYEIILEYGHLPASTVASRAKISRVTTYKILDQLVVLGIAEKRDIPKSVATFGPTDPENLRKLIDQKQMEITSFKNACETAIQIIRPKYNLLTNKPGVLFYEGIDGVKKVLDDSLYTTETIYQYVDIEAVTEHFSQVNAEYVAKRLKSNIQKKVLVADTPIARKYFTEHGQELVDVHFIGKEKIPFGSSMQIYDNKISYVTIGKNDNELIGVIIEDERLATMHKYLFEVLFDLVK